MFVEALMNFRVGEGQMQANYNLRRLERFVADSYRIVVTSILPPPKRTQIQPLLDVE